MHSPPNLALAIRATSITDTTVARDRAATRPALALGSDFDSLGPAAKVRRLATSSCWGPALFRLFDTGAQVNILQTARSPHPDVAA